MIYEPIKRRVFTANQNRMDQRTSTIESLIREIIPKQENQTGEDYEKYIQTQLKVMLKNSPIQDSKSSNPVIESGKVGDLIKRECTLDKTQTSSDETKQSPVSNESVTIVDEFEHINDKAGRQPIIVYSSSTHEKSIPSTTSTRFDDFGK